RRPERQRHHRLSGDRCDRPRLQLPDLSGERGRNGAVRPAAVLLPARERVPDHAARRLEALHPAMRGHRKMNRRGPRAFFGPESSAGQAIVMVAIVFMTLMFAVGLALDAGQLFSAKRTQQEAADAGAFAGAVVLYQGGTVLQATAAAIADAAK